jgi:septal ring factor EnvC (AmiA/AmiB activator)
MHDLNVVYDELKGNIIPFLKLYRSDRAAGMSEQDVVNLLKIANDNLPTLEHRYNRLKQEVNSLETRKLDSNRTLQDLKNQISTLRKTLGYCDLTCKQQAEKITHLQAKKIALEDLVRRFENNNEEYLKIHQTVKDKVGSTLSDGKGLLRLAIYSLIESIRNEPVKFSSLIYNSDSISLPGQQQYLSLQDLLYRVFYVYDSTGG